MKKILIVNNNMKVGGVQKSLYNLLWSIYDKYDITLFLFSACGEYIDKLPKTIKIIGCESLFRFLGISQNECIKPADKLIRGFFAILCRVFHRPAVVKLLLLTQKFLPYKYDIAISYLQNGSINSFYGGVNEFVLKKVNAERKIAFLHCDYSNCGANNPKNNKLYFEFDRIAACSEGCRESFVNIIPELSEKCFTVKNFHRFETIKDLALIDPVKYEAGKLNVLTVGRLAHEKAVDRAIKAVDYVSKKQLPVMLHIVGTGSMEPELENLTASLNLENKVCFYGEQSNPYRFMAGADLLIMTSYHEAAPMVIDEAYALGLPVLTTKTTSSKEMIITRECGWVCGNSQNSINRYLENIAEKPDIVRKMHMSICNCAPDNSEAFEQLQILFDE